MNTPVIIAKAPIEGASTHRLSGVPAPPPLPRGHWPHPTKRDPYGMQRITDKTAETFGITCDFLLHGGKEERSSWPRMVAMHLCVQRCSCKLRTIAHFFRRHYSTVLYGSDKVKERMDVDATVKRVVQEISKAL